MKKKTVRLLLCVTLVAVMAAISSVTVFAAGDVAGAIENTWTQANLNSQHRQSFLPV